MSKIHEDVMVQQVELLPDRSEFDQVVKIMREVNSLEPGSLTIVRDEIENTLN